MMLKIEAKTSISDDFLAEVFFERSQRKDSHWLQVIHQ
jgi:hypothetical protein